MICIKAFNILPDTVVLYNIGIVSSRVFRVLWVSQFCHIAAYASQLLSSFESSLISFGLSTSLRVIPIQTVQHLPYQESQTRLEINIYFYQFFTIKYTVLGYYHVNGVTTSIPRVSADYSFMTFHGAGIQHTAVIGFIKL